MQGKQRGYDPITGQYFEADCGALLNAHREEFDTELDHGWAGHYPGHENITMRCDSHIFYVQCAKADELTKAEIVGRQKMRKLCRVMRKYGDPTERYAIVNDSSCVGIRDTYHYKTKYAADYIDMFSCHSHADNILNGTYSGDVQNEVEGTTWMELDGTYTRMDPQGNFYKGNWRAEAGLPTDIVSPQFYTLPFKTLVQEKCKNIIAAGRMVNADPVAFGALRVMVNLNQIGEAAGVAAYLAVSQNKSVQELDGVEVARTLSKGGSANLG